MVALGQENSNDSPFGPETDLCEFINLADSTSSCNNLPAYPLSLRLSTGQVVNSVPIITGGCKSDCVSNVYKFDIKSNSWLSLGNLATPRYLHSSTILDGALLIIGGLDSGNYYLNSTELVYPNDTITSGPDLPTPRAFHCSVQLEGRKIVIIGGGNTFDLDGNHKMTTIYDPVTSTYTNGPDMLFDHYNFGCAHFYSQKHGGRPVVLSAGGGYGGGHGGSKAEVYDYTLENGTWEESKHLHSRLKCLRGVPVL